MDRVRAERRLRMERLLPTVALPGAAGMVNTVGFLELGTFTSHMTGHTTVIGNALATGGFATALGAAAVVLAFCGGALFTTLLSERAQTPARARFFQPLLWEMVALLIFTYLRYNHPLTWHPQRLRALLCFAMGMQNALTSTIPDAVMRTTHFTGLVTDVGIEIGRLSGWTWQWLRTGSMRAGLNYWQALRGQRDLHKLRLHLRIFLAFLTGAYLGPQLYAQIGHAALLMPCAFLIGLLMLDAPDLRTRGWH